MNERGLRIAGQTTGRGGVPAPAPRRRWMRPVVLAAAMAACLLIGALARPLLLPGERHISYAVDGFLSTEEVRGQAGGDRRVAIRSNANGFAVVVLLIAGQRKEVLPGLGAAPIRVMPGETVLSPPLPPGAASATVALVVVTHTPAEASVRRALRELQYGPDQVDGLRADLARALQAENYGAIGFKQVDLRPSR